MTTRVQCFAGVAVLAAILALPAAATAQTAPAPAAPTFTKDVAPILQRSCVTCHRPGEMAPMSLMTYEEARPWARVDQDARRRARDAAVAHRPDHRHPVVQERSVAERRRDRDDRDVGRRRRAARQPGRHAAAAPVRRHQRVADRQAGPRRSSSRRTRCRRPARICSATSTPTFRSTEDRYIKAIQTRAGDAGSRKVVHHALTYAVDDPTTGRSGDDSQGVDGGAVPRRVRLGQERRGLPGRLGRAAAGRQEGHDQLSPALDRRRDRRRRSSSASSSIPKGYVPKHIRWSKQLAQPTRRHRHPGRHRGAHRRLHRPPQGRRGSSAFQPHMHIRGKRQCLELIYPTGGHVGEDRDDQLRELQLQLASRTTTTRTTSQPLVPAGTILHIISGTTTRQATSAQPGSEELGRRRPAHDRRDGLLRGSAGTT